MESGTPFNFRNVEKSLSMWLANQRDVSLERTAEELPLRRDVVTLLAFVRDNKIVGSPSTGNMPLKAVQEVTAQFVKPPCLEETIGEKTYRIRSEAELWPLYFLRSLAEVGGLIKVGRARLWRLTSHGERFLDADSRLQVAYLLAVWWHRVNWLVAYSFTGMGDALPYGFTQSTLAGLRSSPTGTFVRFEAFADALIHATGLRWGAPDPKIAIPALYGAVNRMVITVLADFGAVEREYREKRLGKSTFHELDKFKITPWGKALLDTVAIAVP
ncbi:MAG: hypothetical protein NTY19_51705 [Planctomycetota bacterium]|nr:hypothetical protein [Planctomycetota bacterium]